MKRKSKHFETLLNKNRQWSIDLNKSYGIEPKIKLTNLWQNYKVFLDSLSVQNFEQYSVLKNWPSIIVEKPNGWKDFVYVVLLAFKDNDFAELFNGYTNEEVMGIQCAITNKYEAIEGKMLAELQGQVFMGVQFGVGYSQETEGQRNRIR